MNTSQTKRNRTLLVFGAGSTAFLNIPPSAEQAEILKNTADDGSYLSRLKNIVLDLFGTDFAIGNVFNIVDSCIALGTSLSSKDHKNILSNDGLRLARKELIRAIFDEFRECIKKRKDGEYKKLVDFYYRLGQDELNHKLFLNGNLGKREAFLADYAIVNFNWDLYSILPLIEAHDRLNHENPYRLDKERVPELRIYTDFGCDCASSLGKNENPWYPFTESVANVVNNDKYEASRRAVLVKAYYPHGLMNMYRCPNCGRHSLYMGEDEEKRLRIDAVSDGTAKDKVYDCPYCGSEVGKLDFEALPQSNFKVRSPHLEELRLAFYGELSQANRIIFIGYSLPEDDIELRTILKAYCQGAEIYVVLKQNSWRGNRFIESSSSDFISDGIAEHDPVIGRFRKTFKRNKLYFNLAGFPESEEEILKLVKHENIDGGSL